MATTKYTDLASYLRSKGLRVVEVAGWQTRSSNWFKTFAPRGIVAHHTAGPAAGGNYPSYNTVLKGRAGILGPLSQFGLGRDGTVYLFGGHRANHAGVGGPLVGIPVDSANAYMWGIEAENSGTQAWPAVQLNAYYRLCAALSVYPKAPFPVSNVIGHKEWAPTRKVDPGGINMAGFRAQIAKARAAITAAPTPPVKPSVPTVKFDGPANGLAINSWSLKYAQQSKGMSGVTLKDAKQFVAFAWSQHLVSNENLHKYTEYCTKGNWVEASVMFNNIVKSTQRKAGVTADGKIDSRLGKFMARFSYKFIYNG